MILIVVQNMQICIASVHAYNTITQLGDSNEAKTYLAFGYCFPTSLLISHVKTVFNH